MVKLRIVAISGMLCLALPRSLPAATITVLTNRIGGTPHILGLNCGHFYPGGNTTEWWRYSRVNGARMFIAPANIEPTDDLAPVGDGVTNQDAFLARRAAIRTNQFNPAYINWSVFNNSYENTDLAGNNHIKVNFALSELRKLGIETVAQITASQSRLPIGADTDWPNIWELWQHYYAQAFYLARFFDVHRFQMYNEPNHSPVVPTDQLLLRMRLSSDAVQLAVSDVNTLYGKSLVPKMLAPVSAGSAVSGYPGYGDLAVTNRHMNVIGQVDPNYWLMQVYDYHQYGSAPAAFGADLAQLNGLLDAAMSPDPRFPTSISEFNTRTGASFDATPTTLDTVGEYARFGSICANLAANSCDELYCFKFSQTASGGAYGVQKNALHYVDEAPPYNIGGITKAGEVWRLFNKAFGAGRSRLGVLKGSGATSLDACATYDPAADRYYLYLVNYTSTGVSLSLDLSSWGIPSGNQVLLEEVSEDCYGAGVLWTNASTVLRTLKANNVWLLSASPRLQSPVITVPASDDAEVRDGANRSLNFGSEPVLMVANDPANAANRSAGFIKFHLPTNDLADLEFAVLSLSVASTTNGPVQAHVYGTDTHNWSQAMISWTTALNLKDNVPAGAAIANDVVEGLGASVHLLGQLVASSTNTSERLVDVTEFVRAQAGPEVSFMISQDPRWNVALPSLTPGDIQPGGLAVVTLEGATPETPAPRLRLAYAAATGSTNGPHRVTAVRANTDGSMSLEFIGQTGQTYLVQASTNLPAADWVNLNTNGATNGVWSYTDRGATNFQRRFYRSARP